MAWGLSMALTKMADAGPRKFPSGGRLRRRHRHSAPCSQPAHLIGRLQALAPPFITSTSSLAAHVELAQTQSNQHLFQLLIINFLQYHYCKMTRLYYFLNFNCFFLSLFSIFFIFFNFFQFLAIFSFFFLIAIQICFELYSTHLYCFLNLNFFF